MPSSIRRIRSSPAGLSVVSLIGLLGCRRLVRPARRGHRAWPGVIIPRQRRVVWANCSPFTRRRYGAEGWRRAWWSWALHGMSSTSRGPSVHSVSAVVSDAMTTGHAESDHREPDMAHGEPPGGDRGRLDVRLRARRRQDGLPAELPGHDAGAGRCRHRQVRGRRLHVAHRRAAAGRVGRVSRSAAELGGLHRSRRQHLGVHGRACGGRHRAGPGRGRRPDLRVDAAGRPQEEAAHGQPLLRDPGPDSVRRSVRPPGGVALRHGGPASHA